MGERDISDIDCILYEGGGDAHVHPTWLFVSQHIDFERKVEGYAFKFDAPSIVKAEGEAEAFNAINGRRKGSSIH